MKALVKEKPEPGIALREVPDPALKPGEVIVDVKACGISGSEVARYLWTPAYHAGGAKDMSRNLPRIMGHEFSGTVAAVGQGVEGVSTGERVVIQSVVGCGSCEYCDGGYPNLCGRRRTIGVNMDGGFAEYIAVPVQNVYRVPDEVSLEVAALMQPFAIGAYAVEVAGIQPGNRVGVWGVGAVGTSIIQSAQLAGATVDFAVGRSAPRLEAVRALGVAHTISVNDTQPEKFLVQAFGRGTMDVVFEASGSVQALGASFPILKKRGRLVLVGNLKEAVNLDLLPVIMDHIHILSVRTYSLSAWRRALAVIGRVRSDQSEFVLRRIPLSDGVGAFAQAAAGAGVKFVIEP